MASGLTLSVCAEGVRQSFHAGRLWSRAVAGHLYTLPYHPPNGTRSHTVNPNPDTMPRQLFLADRHKNYTQSIDPAPAVLTRVQ